MQAPESTIEVVVLTHLEPSKLELHDPIELTPEALRDFIKGGGEIVCNGHAVRVHGSLSGGSVAIFMDQAMVWTDGDVVNVISTRIYGERR